MNLTGLFGNEVWWWRARKDGKKGKMGGGEVKGILVWSEWGVYFFMEEVEG